jgi:hypothetical protein
MEIVIVDVGPDGKIRMESQGFQGEACMVALRDMKAKLGGAVTEEKTAEYFAGPQQAGAVKESQR